MNASPMNATANVPPIYALVLAGGRSTRMQRDKAALVYHGRSQLEWAVSFLQRHVQRVFVSVRPDQTKDPVRARFDQIVDTQDDLGPIAGIMAAQAQHPDVAWLVLACDLPFLDEGTLTTLIAARQPQRLATAFRSSHDVLPEPLCAIYEPASREAILTHVASGKNCPRKFLINSDVQLLDEPNPHALDNVNTPDEYGSAVAALSPTEIPGAKNVDASTGRVHIGAAPSPAGTTPPRTTGGSASASGQPATALNAAPADKRIKVQYYAILREQAGRSDESVVTGANTPRDLYNELKSRYPFSLAPEMLRVAVNAEFGEWSQRLADGDSVVFIPPVAGG
ncbi:MAG TPA: NTP transferase domain-containing protein [Steroidobacteraceae bacterium]|nr:NTP transferase domain-containing protein [Steroidobacteraceae bacterium]